MIDLASIRNASFTLTPTGYNPEEVDRFLADLADQLEAQPVSIEAAPPAPLSLPPTPAARPEADIDGLSGAIDRTIGALDAFVQNELAAVRAASDLEVEVGDGARAVGVDLREALERDLGHVRLRAPI